MLRWIDDIFFNHMQFYCFLSIISCANKCSIITKKKYCEWIGFLFNAHYHHNHRICFNCHRIVNFHSIVNIVFSVLCMWFCYVPLFIFEYILVYILYEFEQNTTLIRYTISKIQYYSIIINWFFFACVCM